MSFEPCPVSLTKKVPLLKINIIEKFHCTDFILLWGTVSLSVKSFLSRRNDFEKNSIDLLSKNAVGRSYWESHGWAL